MCPTNVGVEDTEHFLLLCSSFDIQRQDLLAGVLDVSQPFSEVDKLSDNTFLQVLLCSDEKLQIDINRNILLLTLAFILQTGRFNQRTTIRPFALLHATANPFLNILCCLLLSIVVFCNRRLEYS